MKKIFTVVALALSFTGTASAQSFLFLGHGGLLTTTTIMSVDAARKQASMEREKMTKKRAENKKLAQEMIENGGAIISEFNSTDKPDREHFLQRNRIIAGFSSITIVVETAFGGGSISTVSYANGYNREVYALPGKISDKYSQGCNLIISQNKARIISKFQDILDDLGIDKESVRIPSLFETKTIKLNKEAQPIYDCIAENIQISLDDLSEKLEIPPFKLLPILLDLELKSYIKALSGKQYRIS